MPIDTPTATDTLLAFLNNPTTTIVARLAKNQIDPDADALQLSDFIECNFPGYNPARAFDWAAAEQDDTLLGEVLSAELHFVAGAVTVPQQCTALYLEVKVGDQDAVLFQAEVFSEPITFDREGQTLKRQIRILTPPTA